MADTFGASSIKEQKLPDNFFSLYSKILCFLLLMFFNVLYTGILFTLLHKFSNGKAGMLSLLVFGKNELIAKALLYYTLLGRLCIMAWWKK